MFKVMIEAIKNKIPDPIISMGLIMYHAWNVDKEFERLHKQINKQNEEIEKIKNRWFWY